MFQFQKTIGQSKSRKEKRERARERERREEESRSKSKSPVQRKPLKDRNYKVDLESRLGKTQLVVTPVVAPGYYCSVCVCV